MSISYPSYSALQSDLAAEKRAMRRQLIEEFSERQKHRVEYVSLTEVARIIAKDRGDSDSAKALKELMGSACVGAFDNDKPPLLLLWDKVGVELQRINPNCQPADGEDEPPLAAQLSGAARGDPESLKERRAVVGDEAILTQIMPRCWVRRDTAVDLLKKKGVAQSSIPPEWAPLPPKQERACVYFAIAFPGGKVPPKSELQQQKLKSNLLAWDRANGGVLAGTIDEATLKLAVEAYNAGRRALT